MHNRSVQSQTMTRQRNLQEAFGAKLVWCALQPHACCLVSGDPTAPTNLFFPCALQAAERQVTGAATGAKDAVRRVARAASSATGHRTVLITRDGRRYTKKCAPCCLVSLCWPLGSWPGSGRWAELMTRDGCRYTKNACHAALTLPSCVCATSKRVSGRPHCCLPSFHRQSDLSCTAWLLSRSAAQPNLLT